MPPKLAQNRSLFSSRLHLSTRPSATRMVNASTHLEKQPSAWWALPCTSLPMQPPTVTSLVPGVIIGNQPRGVNCSMMSPRVTPASQVSTPVALSNA